MASLLVELLSMRIAAQSAISLVLAPLAAAVLVPFVAGLPIPLRARGTPVASAVAYLVTLLPAQLRTLAIGIIGNRAIAITAIAALLVSQLVPLTLSMIDEYYSLRSARTAARARTNEGEAFG